MMSYNKINLEGLETIGSVRESQKGVAINNRWSLMAVSNYRVVFRYKLVNDHVNKPLCD